MEDQALYNKLIRIAVSAGNAIMKIYSGEIEVELKDDDSPLTAADKASHDIINSALSEIEYQGCKYPVVSEEGSIPPFGQRREWGRFWLIDPLDGTKEFVNRRDEFTVNIALIEKDYPVLGLVYLPVKRMLYFGGPGRGAWRASAAEPGITGDGSSDPVSAAVSLPLSEDDPQIASLDPAVLRAAGSRSHRSEQFDSWVTSEAERRGCSGIDVVTAGSSLKFCLAAEGVVDVYPRFGPTMEWDTAAAHAVVEGAGKHCTRVDGGKMYYNKPVMRNEGFIVF